ncbi:MAG TPA: hypothetical protein VKT49_05260 [Bryobacteraceae bacterium]|nr:hypothetical protein [Bryobacteraceae bacterium]
MCDYSLMAFPNRLAVAGEQLVVTKFTSGTIGLAQPSCRQQGWWAAMKAFFSPPELPVVCIPPGASLKLQDIPQPLQIELEIGPEEDVTFTQLSARANTHRDAVRFANGKEILLQRLQEGQRVTVLDLSGGDGLAPASEQRMPHEFEFTI